MSHYGNRIRPVLLANSVCRQCFFRLATRHASSIARQAQLKSHNRFKLPDSPARTRFAPSPTGFLHLGSLRTALYNYLLAKATGGQFLLRLEDTDTKRTVPDAERRLYEDLRWTGLQWDEGPEVNGPYGPYRQSERTELYREHATKLVANGHAYRCFCSPQRLADLAEQRSKLGLPTDYDRTCASLSAAESEDRASEGAKHTIRLKVPDEYPNFHDIVYGAVGREKKRSTKHVTDAWEDPVLLKSDGFPTYNLANVVDDHHMHITHVIRGTEWMAMTPKHLAMYEAFGWEPPKFAHVPLLTDQDGAKLSKRMGSTDVRSFREEGILPEALVNFVALLGWSHNAASDVMDLEKLTENFTLKFTKGNAAVNSKKLEFFQRRHLDQLTARGDKSPSINFLVNQIHGVITKQLEGKQPNVDDILQGRSLEDYIFAILKVDGMNYKTADDFVSRNSYFFSDPISEHHPTQDASSRPVTTEETAVINDVVLQQLDGRASFNAKDVVDALARQLNETNKLEPIDRRNDAEANEAQRDEDTKLILKKIYGYLRGALAGGKSGMNLKDMIEIMGPETVKRRLEKYPTSDKL